MMRDMSFTTASRKKKKKKRKVVGGGAGKNKSPSSSTGEEKGDIERLADGYLMYPQMRIQYSRSNMVRGFLAARREEGRKKKT